MKTQVRAFSRRFPVLCATLAYSLVVIAWGSASPSQQTARGGALLKATENSRLTFHNLDQSSKLPAPNLTVPRPVYDTPDEIKSMQPCSALVIQKRPCSAYLQKKDGTAFTLGSPGMKADVGLFFDTLQVGHTYKLPDAFLRWQKKQAAH